MAKSDLDPIFVKALGYLKSNKPGSDRLLYDLLAEYTKRPSRWLNSAESKVTDITETLVISEESSSSSDISKGTTNSDSAGAGTEIVELVSLDELPANLSKRSRRLESEEDIVDDDDISQLMSETGVVMVMEEQGHVTRGDDSLFEEEDMGLAPNDVVFSDDEETDSCDEFEGFSRVSSREQTPDRSTLQPLASSGLPVTVASLNHRSITPPAIRSGPPPLTRVEFSRSMSWDKSIAGRLSPSARDVPPLLLHSTPTTIVHPKPVYPRSATQSMPSGQMYPASTPRRFHQMKRQASQLTQNIKGPAKKQTQ